jgi:hypothetical protein
LPHARNCWRRPTSYSYPNPQAEDLAELREGQVLWGWPRCVQDRTIAQLAIDKKLTLIAFWAMNHWASEGGFGLHVFHKNNELAGYCSVLHSLALIGRLERHVSNAEKVARWLEERDDVESVAYAGLPSSPWYERGRKYGQGGRRHRFLQTWPAEPRRASGLLTRSSCIPTSQTLETPVPW